MGSPIVAIHIRDSSAKLLGLQFKFWQVFCRIYTNSCIVQHFSKCFAMSSCNSINSWTNQTAEFNPSAIWLNGMVLALATGCCKNLENALRHLKQFINCFISYLHWTCASLNRTTTVDCCMVTLSLYTLWNVYSDVCVYVSIVLHAGQSRWSFDLWPLTCDWACEGALLKVDSEDWSLSCAQLLLHDKLICWTMFSCVCIHFYVFNSCIFLNCKRILHAVFFLLLHTCIPAPHSYKCIYALVLWLVLHTNDTAVSAAA